MTIAIIVAHDPHLVIGKDRDLPWHYSEDMKYFKRITMGHPIIMGRTVFEELDQNPLPGRENIVLSRRKTYKNVSCFTSINEALQHLEDEEIVFCIGGGEIYRQFLSLTDKLFITEIHQAYEGDTFFPEYRDKIASTWKEIKRYDHDACSFVVYDRVKK